jgi:hypothetical protein
MNTELTRYASVVVVSVILVGSCLHAEEAVLGYRIQLDTISRGYDGKTCWSTPAGTIPGENPSASSQRSHR